MVFTREREGKGMRGREGGREGGKEKDLWRLARKIARYMWRGKRSIWEMERQIPNLLELVFRIKLAKIANGRGLPSLLEMLLYILKRKSLFFTLN